MKKLNSYDYSICRVIIQCGFSSLSFTLLTPKYRKLTHIFSLHKYTIPEVMIMEKLKSYMIKGTIFVVVLGTASHFLYDLTKGNPIIGFFTPVSESVWEHMKLVFFPMLLYSLYSIPTLRKKYPCIISAYASGILIGTLLVPVIFYTYSGILGRNFLILDIGTFLLCVLLAFFSTYHFTQNCRMQNQTVLLCTAVLILFITFIFFSYHTPDIALFRSK